MKIRNWAELYENAASRKLIRLSWVPVPNKHDGEKYSQLMNEKDAPILFTCWILLLQIASRSKERGTLIKDDGTPHTATSLALKTRGKIQWFERAIPYLLTSGWIEESGESPGALGESPGVSGLKGREGRETRKIRGLLEAQRLLVAQGNGQI